MTTTATTTTTAATATSSSPADPHSKTMSDFTIWKVRKQTSSDGSPFSLKSLVPKRKRNQTLVPKRTPSIDSIPPPPPPKDKRNNDHNRRSFSPAFYGPEVPGRHSREPTISLSHVNVSTHEFDNPTLPPLPGSLLPSSQNYIPFIPFRKPQGPPRIISPAEKARLRLEAEREREFEARLAVREEEERQVRLKAEKEDILRRSLEEDARRKASMERDLRMAGLKRRERERIEQEAEAVRAKELEERKKADRDRRLEESQKWQAWRDEQERKREIIALMNDDQKRHMLEEKRGRRRDLYNKLKTESTGGVLLTGWLSTQMPQSMTWRRRYFALFEDALHLYKSPADLAQPNDVIQIENICDVRDAGDITEEEPEFIPHSFVVEEAEGGCWAMFTDDQQTKDTLIAALIHAAGLADNSPRVASTASSFFSRIPRFSGM